MKNSNSFLSPSPRETGRGLAYLAFQLLFLSGALNWLDSLLPQPLGAAELNFLYYLINFLAVTVLFRDFLGRSFRQVTAHPALFLQALVLGLTAYWACGSCVGELIRRVAPDFSNYNDQAIAAMAQGSRFLMALGTVILVPPAEECLYRGVIFRSLYRRSPPAAYLVSMTVFAAVHLLGYLNVYSPWELLLALLQYLPAGLCLAWSYVKSGTIFAPIVIHALVNLSAIAALR